MGVVRYVTAEMNIGQEGGEKGGVEVQIYQGVNHERRVKSQALPRDVRAIRPRFLAGRSLL